MTKDKVKANGRRKAVAILMLVAMMISAFGAAAHLTMCWYPTRRTNRPLMSAYRRFQRTIR